MDVDNFIFADFGKRQWTLVFRDQTRVITREQFAAGEWQFENASGLLVESAHLATPRRDLSLAQVYDAETLAQIWRNAPVPIYFWPQRLTPKARAMAGIDDKSDVNDCYAIREMIKRRRIPLRMAPRRLTTKPTDSWMEALEWRHETNKICNQLRNEDYRFELFPGFHARLKSLSLAKPTENRLLDIAHCYFVKARGRVDADASSVKGACGHMARPTYIASLAALLIDLDGNSRMRACGSPPGVKWLFRTQIGNNPYIRGGGVVRSNLYHHYMKSVCRRQPQLKRKKWPDYTPEQRELVYANRRGAVKLIKILLQYIRDGHDGASVESHCPLWAASGVQVVTPDTAGVHITTP